MGVVHAYVLLEVLEGVVGSLGQAVEAAVKVARLDMAVGEESGRRNCVVGGEPVKRVGQHVVRRVFVCSRYKRYEEDKRYWRVVMRLKKGY
jgi:hypothetical protein